MTGIIRRSRLGDVVAILICIAVSGLPGLALAAVGVEPIACESACEGSVGDDTCSPVCSAGPCAKVSVATAAPAPVMQAPTLRNAPVAPVLSLTPPISGARDGLFQPPKP